MRSYWIPAVFSIFLLVSCSRQSANAPHATVTLRDGTQVAGKVVANSPTELTLAGDDSITRTIPMAQVRSVSYDDTPAPVPAPAPGAPSPEPVAASSPSAPAPAPPTRSASADTPPADRRADHEDHYHPQAAAVTTRTYEIAAGSQVSVRTEEAIDSGRAVEGQTFPAEVTKDVRDAEGAVVIPRGANASIVIRSASKGGRFRGTADLVLDLASVSIDGRQYQLETSNISQRGRDSVGKNKRTAEFTGGGAALGAIIGAIAGGGKGAAIGAGSGAGAGALTQILTRGGSIKVPVESVLTFRLEQPLQVVAAQ
jgi:hypothetical protein